MSKRIIKLTQVDPAVEEMVELPSGREIAVRSADAGAFELVMDVWDVATGKRSATPDDLKVMLKIVQRVLPDSTAEERSQLTTPMMVAVIQIASGRAAEVYALLGESSAPGVENDSRRSTPDIPSAPLSSA